jgi:hypothetical protein
MKVWILVLSALCLSAPVSVSPVLARQDTYREAYDLGHSDGLTAGRLDRSTRKPFDFANKTEYQEARNGFDGETHDREVFIVAYRRGFEDGYEEGYGLGRNRQGTAPATVAMPAQDPEAVLGRKVLPKGTELRVRLLETLSTQRNEAGDQFRAEVAQPVELDGEVVVPVGARLEGIVTHLKRAGRIKGRSEMALRFQRMGLPDGAEMSCDALVVELEPRREEEVRDDTGTIQAQGEVGDDAKRVGTSAGIGALIGILSGGRGGARTGAAVGALAGTAGVLATRGSDMILPAETEMTIRLERDLTVATGILRAAP